jgi:uncharacterized SAM-binding protein YcdF (DUF218 family)
MHLLLFIMLGCNVPALLEGRIKKSIEFANTETNNTTQIDWFLSGGIKNPDQDTVTEAEKMTQMIANKNNQTASWNFIRDEEATNTAENFIMVKNKVVLEDYENVYVITSDFHYKRANMIANKIIEGNQFKWILSPEELVDSRTWEKVHIKNVDSDVNKAKQKFYTRI